MVRRAVGTVPPASPEAGTLVDDVGGSTSTVTDTGLSPSTTYSYAVFAHDAVPNYAPGATTTVTTPSFAAGAVHVCGDITANTTWAPSSATAYVLDCGVTVRPGRTLTIQPGTIVKGSLSAGLHVQGSLVANGTTSSPVVFTSLRDDSAAGDTNGDGSATSPAAGDWSGISVSPASGGGAPSISLDRAVVSYASQAVSASSAGSVSVTNSNLRRTSSDAVSVTSTPTVTIRGNTIDDAGFRGIYVGMDQGDTTHAPTVTNNTITNAENRAIVVFSDHLVPTQLSGNSGSSNGIDVIEVAGRLAGNLTLPQAGLPWAVGQCCWSLTVDPGVTMTLNAGAVLKFDISAGLNVQGSLVANGTAASPVVFTSLRDDSAGGDTNGDGSATLPAASDWSGISASPASGGGGPVVSLDHAVVSYGSQAVSASSAGSVSVANSTLRHTGSDAVSVTSTPAVTIRGNTIDDAGFRGIYVGMDQGDTTHAPTVTNNTITNAENRAIVVFGDHLLPAQLSGNSGSSNGIGVIEVAGRLAGNLTLPQAGLPWSVGQCCWSLTVDPGATMTLNAGAVLKFDTSAGLNVQGSLVTNGTTSSPVVFTSLRDDSVGGDTNGDGAGSLPAASDWSGITASPASGGGGPSVSLDHAVVSYGSQAISAWSASSVSVSNSTLRQTGSDAVSVTSTPAVTIRGNTIDHAGFRGIYVGMDQGDTTHAPTVTNNTITNAENRAIVVFGDHLLPAQLSGNSGSSNGIGVIEVAGRLAGNLTLPQPGLPWAVGQCCWSLTVDPGATMTLNAGAVLKFDISAGLNVQGSLVANGTAASPVVFTSLRDDSVGGDTNGDGAGTLPAASDWSGITASPASGGGGPVVSFDHAVVSYGSQAVSAWSASSVSVTNSTLRHTGSDAVSVTSTPTVTVRGNTIDDAGFRGIYVGMDQGDTTHAPTVTNNTITNAENRAIVVFGDHLLPAQLTGNTGSSNGIGVIEVAGRLAGNLTLPQPGLPWAVGQCCWSLTVDPGVTMTLNAGAVLKFDISAGLNVQGSLVANGTTSSPVVLTSLRDDSVGGDTNGDGSGTLPAAGDWWGISASPADESNVPVVHLDGIELRYPSTALSVGGPADAWIHGAIRHAQTGISSSDTWIDATDVDWGDPSGPAPIGTGASVQGSGVFYTPWVGWVAPPRPPVAPPAPPIEDPACKDVLVIGVRGSGDPPQPPDGYADDADGFGAKAWDAYYGFEQRLHQIDPDATIGVYGLRYRALGVLHNPINFGASGYIDSIYEGVDHLKDKLREEAEQCGDSQDVVLIGYSQGALVIHLALRDLDASQLISPSRLTAVVLIADPAKTANGNETIWQGEDTYAGDGIRNAEGIWTKLWDSSGVTGPLPSAVTGQTISLCRNNDIVCAPGLGSNFWTHTGYTPAESNSAGRWAAERAADHIS